MKILTPQLSGAMSPSGSASTYGSTAAIASLQLGGTFSADFGPDVVATLPAPDVDGYYQLLFFAESTDANVLTGAISLTLTPLTGTPINIPNVLTFTGSDDSQNENGSFSFVLFGLYIAGGTITIEKTGAGFSGAAGGYRLSVTILKLA